MLPDSKTGSESHLLIFLIFPFSPAFSHKELIAHFRPDLGLSCQNDEVSPMCTPLCMPRPWVPG